MLPANLALDDCADADDDDGGRPRVMVGFVGLGKIDGAMMVYKFQYFPCWLVSFYEL